MEQTILLCKQMDDLARKALGTGNAASKFLTPAESHQVSMQFASRNDVALSFDGGFKGAERVRAVFTNPDWGGYERAELFAALKAGHRPQDTIGHRDILGALMSLGIARNTIGDIVSDFIICLPELSGYIIEHLNKAGRIGIQLSPVDLESLPIRQETLHIKTETVASLRLDVLLCAAFGLTRTNAAKLIAAGRVNLDYEPCLQPAKELREGSLLSVRGMGRAKLSEVGGTSKKGRIFVQIGLYGRH